jgi:putative SOS response-associated peptidase YedK
MPVMLARKDWDDWLDAKTAPVRLQAILHAPPEQTMRCYRVGTHVNNPRNDDADCLAPVKSGS